MSAKRPSNPLALAVLALTYERPMHPYEMAATLKERGKDDSIKIRYGSLYTVIEQLLREGLIRAAATERDSRRPERTVYAITPTGETELLDWMRDLLSRPVHEFPQFEAGLSLLGVVRPEEAVPLFQKRLAALDLSIAARERIDTIVDGKPLHPLFLVESDYRLAMERAERRFVASLIERISAEDWAGASGWSRWHEAKREREKGGGA